MSDGDDDGAEPLDALIAQAASRRARHAGPQLTPKAPLPLPAQAAAAGAGAAAASADGDDAAATPGSAASRRRQQQRRDRRRAELALPAQTDHAEFARGDPRDVVLMSDAELGRSLLGLSDDLLVEMFGKLGAREFAALARTCRRLLRLSCDHTLWLEGDLRKTVFGRSTFSATGMAHVLQRFDPAHITALVVSAQPFVIDQSLQPIARLSALTSLKLSYLPHVLGKVMNVITAEPLVTSLTVVSIKMCPQFVVSRIGAFSRMPNLKTLETVSLSGPITAALLEPVMKACRQLESLHAPLDHGPAHPMARVMRKLRHRYRVLHLTGDDVYADVLLEYTEARSLLSALGSMKLLALPSVDARLELFLDVLRSSTSLETLLLEGVDSFEWRFLEPCALSIKRIDASYQNMPFSAIGLGVFPCRFPSLTKVILDQVAGSSKGILTAFAENCPALQCLTLGKVPGDVEWSTSDEDLIRFVELLPDLQELTLARLTADSGMTDMGISAIFTLSKLRRLELHLDAAFSPAAFDGIVALQNLDFLSVCEPYQLLSTTSHVLNALTRLRRLCLCTSVSSPTAVQFERVLSCAQVRRFKLYDEGNSINTTALAGALQALSVARRPLMPQLERFCLECLNYANLTAAPLLRALPSSVQCLRMTEPHLQFDVFGTTSVLASVTELWICSYSDCSELFSRDDTFTVLAAMPALRALITDYGHIGSVEAWRVALAAPGAFPSLSLVATVQTATMKQALASAHRSDVVVMSSSSATGRRRRVRTLMSVLPEARSAAAAAARRSGDGLFGALADDADDDPVLPGVGADGGDSDTS